MVTGAPACTWRLANKGCCYAMLQLGVELLLACLLNVLTHDQMLAAHMRGCRATSHGHALPGGYLLTLSAAKGLSG